MFLVIAACSSPNQQDAASRAVRAARPPADYTLIGSADTSDGKNIQIGLNTNLVGVSKEDERLSIHFGFHCPNAVHDARPADFGSIGDGLSVNTPIVFSPPVSALAEVQSAVNLVTKRSPDRTNVVGALFRSPEHRYILLVEFDGAAGERALYFDVTNWAIARLES
ncbi:hypothetical protein [Dongia deserti]|uniref:hypothetical protein n=1 Tax=Dongia deserti TaxID=2268030 RepID=UPI000E64D202|nr:hypothetical protein [Dongia deserti]